MVGHPEADPAAVDEVLPDRVAPFGLTLEKKSIELIRDVFLRHVDNLNTYTIRRSYQWVTYSKLLNRHKRKNSCI